VTDKPKPEQKKADKSSINAVKERAASKAAEVRPNPSNEKKPKVFTSTIEKGGAVKTGDQKGSNAQTKDVSQMGLAAAFGGSGLRKNLDKAYSGSGGIIGLSEDATGRSGDNENRAGDDIGSKFKNVGAGGKGTATQGISGIGTKGRSSGMSTYGSGTGLGGKGQVNIEASGEDASWEGTIDREAVRRVIRSILAQIKNCYERQLRVNSQLEGKVVIQFEIGAQGRVDIAKTRSTTLNDTMTEACVAARIKEARFPEPPPGSIAVVDYPFVFGAQK
jgi:outer membrane biosynthesis protein TonB